MIDGGGGVGADIVTYAARIVPVSITFDGVANDGAAGENDELIAITQVTGGQSNDTMTGDAGLVAFNGGPGNDTLDAGGGPDSMNGDAGNDTLLGGPGPVGGVADNDLIFGGAGVDTVRYAGRLVPVTVNLSIGAGDGAAGENDTVNDTVENVVGGTAGDILTGSALGNRLAGGDGNDTLNAVDNVSGNDQLNGGQNTDTCTADAGDTVVNCE